MSEPIQRPGLFGVRVRLLFVALACVIVSLFVFNWLMLRQFDSKESTAKLQEVNSMMQQEKETNGRRICQWISNEDELEKSFIYEQKADLRIYLQKKMAAADLDYVILLAKKPDPNTKKSFTIFERAFRDENLSNKTDVIVESHMANPKQLLEREGLLGLTEEFLLDCETLEAAAKDSAALSAKDEAELLNEKVDDNSPPQRPKAEKKKCVAGYLLVGMKPANQIAIDLLRPEFFKILTPISIGVIVLLVFLFLFVPLRVKMNVRV